MSWRRGLLVALVVSAAAGVLAAPDDDPVFVRFLVSGDPFDETLRDYWERSERDELDAVQLVDLGTMLYERGFPKDAIRSYRKALKADSSLYEAWFRIGLTYHGEGELGNASQAYRRCLKKSPGHGWANFYLGRLEEEAGHSRNAMYHLQKAFTHAPELADPRVNPEVLDSELALGAMLITHDQRRFEDSEPMFYLQPHKVDAARRQYEPQAPAPPEEADPDAPAVEDAPSGDDSATPPRVEPGASELEPSPTPVPQRPPRSIPVRRAPTPSPAMEPHDRDRGADTTPYGIPEIGSVSGEGQVLP